MVAIALAHRFADGDNTIGVATCPQGVTLMAICLAALRPPRRCCIVELAQLDRKCSLNPLGIRCRELVFEREHLMRPGSKSLRFAELRQLRDQLAPKIFGSVRWQTSRLQTFL